MVSDQYEQGPPVVALAVALPAEVALDLDGPPVYASARPVAPTITGTVTLTGPECVVAYAVVLPAEVAGNEEPPPDPPPLPATTGLPTPVVEVELYDRDLTRLGWLNDFDSLSVTWRHNRRSLATIALPADHLRAAQLLEPGRRIVIRYTPDGGASQTMSGRVGTVQAQGPAGASSLVVTVLGDWVDTALAWPDPGAPLDSQTSAYWTDSGHAETVIKALITATATRLSLPWTIAAAQSRGSAVSISARFVPVSDAVEAAADLGGIGLSMVQQLGGSTIDVDCYVGTDRSARVLSEESGSVTSWSMTVSAPRATRAVVGLQGEGVERAMVEVVDTTAEDDWDLAEMFVDANDLEASQLAEGTQRGWDKLAEQASTVSMAVTLAETDAWRFGRNLFLGDLVAVEPIPGLRRVDRVREARLTVTAEDGPVVEPVVGDPDSTEPERAMASHVARLAAAVRLLRAR